MRKIFKYNLLGLAFLAIGIVACDTASQDVSPVVSPDGYAKATFTTSFTGSTVNEGDTITYNISIDKMIDRSLTFSARINEGTADASDLTVLSGVLAPYTLTTTVKIIFNKDWDVEPVETMKIEIGVFSIADRYLVNKTTVDPILTLSLNNYVSPILGISVNWAKDIVVYNVVDKFLNAGNYNIKIRDTVEVTKSTSAIDYDIYITSAAGFDIMDPWAMPFVAMAATSSCPEVFELEGLDDGEYVIWTDLWANGIPTVTAPTTFLGYKDSTQLALMTTHFTRQGTALDLIVPQDSLQATYVWTPGYDDDGTIFNGTVAKVIVAGGTYTIEDFKGVQSGPWKSNAGRAIRPAEFNKKNR